MRFWIFMDSRTAEQSYKAGFLSTSVRRVEDIKLRRDCNFSELIEQLERAGGFVAKDLAKSVEVLEGMLRDEGCLRFLAFPACVVATGLRGVLRDMLMRRWFDALITSSGTLDHDLARMWRDYYHGSFEADDEELRKRGINRLGSIFIPDESYGLVLEEKLTQIFEEIFATERRIAVHELSWELGKSIAKEARGEESILYWCWRNEIPIFVQGLSDSCVGFQLWLRSQREKLEIDEFASESKLAELIFSTERSGALILGGGISKHHTLWWNQFKGGLDYCVCITTGVEWDGSLSGASTSEAVSWGKVKSRAKHVTLRCEATLALPIIYRTLLEKL